MCSAPGEGAWEVVPAQYMNKPNNEIACIRSISAIPSFTSQKTPGMNLGADSARRNEHDAFLMSVLMIDHEAVLTAGMITAC